jgi:hypothetical protein
MVNKNTFIKELRKEINKLNQEIDRRIVRGISYKTLSRKHKVLVAQLNSATRYPSSSYGFFDRLNRVVSTFMF